MISGATAELSQVSSAPLNAVSRTLLSRNVSAVAPNSGFDNGPSIRAAKNATSKKPNGRSGRRVVMREYACACRHSLLRFGQNLRGAAPRRGGSRARSGGRARGMFRPLGAQRGGQDDHHRDPRRAAAADVGRRRDPRPAVGSDDDEIRQRIGISFQETKLSEKLSVRETLILFRSFYRRGITPDEAIERVELQEKATSWVGKLSGGQRQRLAVACAWSAIPSCCSSTSRRRGSIPARDGSCGRSFVRIAGSAAPCC